ncbi:MAG: hypothetical protein LH606_02275 [Cytophagaceae bacterium]|nr:hypothetical protein [Cytophagaceae bacterium]
MTKNSCLVSALGLGSILFLGSCGNRNAVDPTLQADLSGARITANCKVTTIERTSTSDRPLSSKSVLTYGANGFLSTLSQTTTTPKGDRTSQTTFTRNGTQLMVTRSKDGSTKIHADTLTLNASGQVVAQRRNGYTRTFGYDANGFLTLVTTTSPTNEVISVVTYVIVNGNVATKSVTTNPAGIPGRGPGHGPGHGGRPKHSGADSLHHHHPLHPDSLAKAGHYGKGHFGHGGAFGFPEGGNYTITYEYTGQANTPGLGVEGLGGMTYGTPSQFLVKSATITNAEGVKMVRTYSYTTDPAKPNTLTITITSTGADRKGGATTRTETVVVTFAC